MQELSALAPGTEPRIQKVPQFFVPIDRRELLPAGSVGVGFNDKDIRAVIENDFQGITIVRHDFAYGLELVLFVRACTLDFHVFLSLRLRS